MTPFRRRQEPEHDSSVEVTRLLAIACAGGCATGGLPGWLPHILRMQTAPDALAIARHLGTGLSAATLASAQPAIGPQWLPLLSILARCEQSGADPAPALIALARRQARDEQSRRLRRIRRSGVWLLLPLGLCGLPAFMLLTIVPLLASYVSGVALFTP